MYAIRPIKAIIAITIDEGPNLEKISSQKSRNVNELVRPMDEPILKEEQLCYNSLLTHSFGDILVVISYLLGK
jgi:hypothetical protein